MMNRFQQFLETHSKYKCLYEALLRNKSPDRTGGLLAASARLVYQIQGEGLGPVADEILDFVDNSYSPGYADRYIGRLRELITLQRKFDEHPSTEALGDPNLHVDEDDYSLSLLLSIILTNHRFEIMSQLLLFLKSLERGLPCGRIASIGAGTGYELLLASRTLPTWEIEAYEKNIWMRNRAIQLWSFFQVSSVRGIDALFPLEKMDPMFVGLYDAVIMCELCEHLCDPLGALTRVRAYLKDDGLAFVTMAINLAQEDHVFWYPTVEICRSHIKDAGLYAVSEWLAPQIVVKLPQDRERGFGKGNYIAVVRKDAGSNRLRKNQD